MAPLKKEENLIDNTFFINPKIIRNYHEGTLLL